MKKTAYPDEIVVWYILPLIRRELAMEMKREGLDQKKISSILGITESAVSQYFSQKRATKLKATASLKVEIMRSVKEILKDPQKVIFQVQRLISLPEIKGAICNIHKKEYGATRDCHLCQIGVR